LLKQTSQSKKALSTRSERSGRPKGALLCHWHDRYAEAICCVCLK